MNKILLLAENGFQDTELIYPYYRFQEAGYQAVVIGLKAKETYNGEHGLSIKSDNSPQEVNMTILSRAGFQLACQISVARHSTS